jgi:alanyl-tRNA synthetase
MMGTASVASRPAVLHWPEPMTSDEIRRTYLSFFEERDHLRLSSASLIPAQLDPSALFTIAGMHPLKSYFLGSERPPHPRAASCQKTFRTADIGIIGTTTRHLTFFEMLGNFSFGDYFKREAVRYAWELSLDGFGFRAEDIWVTVFGGDDALGLGPDEEAIEAWLEVGVPRERIVQCPRSENFWELPPPGPCGPCSELYLDRGLERGKPEDLPGGENERFLEYWNLVFMQFDQNPPNTLTPLPARNIDTGLGLNRLAAILQRKETVFETDQFWPLIELGQELSGRRYGQDFPTDRALRVLADHSRAMTFLIADGVVPSNEDRGYVLRRVMRRAILQGRHTLGLAPGFLARYATIVTELMGGEYPELHGQREAVGRWLNSEEEGFGRTLEQGSRLLSDLIERAREAGAEGIAARDAFMLHDTYGFPIDLTMELAAEHGLGVDEAGFEALMANQRRRSRSGPGRTVVGGELRDQAAALAEQAQPTEFRGYELEELETTVAGVRRQDGLVLVKLAASPFYATGGGQVADVGSIRCLQGDCAGRVADVVRLGEDQVVALEAEEGNLEPGERVLAEVDHLARRATERNHTATHLLHAALRAVLGTHVRQAGSYVGPDKLRFDFTHGGALTPQELQAVEDRVNEWIDRGEPVRALTTTLEQARQLGAMALFGEKYGEIVRMVEVGDGSWSRELCGGTHVRRTSEIGVCKILTETSSAANVRRIEACSGPAASALLREHDRILAETAAGLRVPPERVAETAAQLRARVRELERAPRGARGANGSVDLDGLLAQTAEHGDARVLVVAVAGAQGKALLELLDRLKGRLADAAIVLGSAHEDRVELVASVAPSLVKRGVRAGDLVREAAALLGGGGGGRDTLARAGGRDPGRLPEALELARRRIEATLAG